MLPLSPRRFLASVRQLLGLTITSPIRTSVKRNANRFRPALELCEERETPSVTGHIFYDQNGNGVEDGSDAGAPNISVTLYQNDMWAGSAYTNDDGNYSFSVTPTGDDEVTVYPFYDHFPYTLSTANSGGYVAVNSGLADDIGLVGSGNEDGGQSDLSGQLWFDTDGDGVQGAGEDDGPDNVMVSLWYDGWYMGFATTSNGHYSFTDLWGGPAPTGAEYTLSIGPLSGGCTLAAGADTTPVLIGGNDTTADLRIVLPVVTVERISKGTEGGADGTFRFTRTGDLSDTLTVYFTVGGTAAGSGTDYSLMMGTSVTFSSSSPTADVTVSVNDDGTNESTETVVLTLTPGGNSYRAETPTSVIVNILDNDTPPVVFVVTTNLDVVDANDGVTSLREAVNQANAALNSAQQLITFASNLNGQTISLDSQLTLTKNIYIAGARALTIQRNVNVAFTRLFEIAATSESIIAGLKLRGGALFGDSGGAILNGGILTVTGCIIRDNIATQGGGIGTRARTISGVTSRSVLNIYDTIITNNTASDGGGIFVLDGELTAQNGVEISNNTATQKGGGIFISQGDAGLPSIVTLNDIYISANTAAESGGGIYCDYGSLTLNGGSITFNQAVDPGQQRKGGGIFLDSNATLTAANSPTIANNTATTGDGIYIVLNASKTGNIIFDNDSVYDENPI